VNGEENPKFEARNPKQIQMKIKRKIQNSHVVLRFEISLFEFVSDFGFRASDFVGVPAFRISDLQT